MVSGALGFTSGDAIPAVVEQIEAQLASAPRLTAPIVDDLQLRPDGDRLLFELDMGDEQTAVAMMTTFVVGSLVIPRQMAARQAAVEMEKKAAELERLRQKIRDANRRDDRRR